MRLAVGIATRGRAVILLETLRLLHAQVKCPDRVLICYTAEADGTGVREAYPEVELLLSAPGSACQRNVLLRSAANCDAVLFLDDDFLVAPSYIAVMTEVMASDPSIAVVTGTVIADGAKGPGLSLASGLMCLQGDMAPDDLSSIPWFNGYGCNMGIRMSVVRQHRLEFDERLPLYAWYEDIDFTRRVGLHGRTVKLHGARGVHLGTKSGRTSGRRLGYSQVANPIYLARKGSFPWSNTVRSVGRNVLMNCFLSIRPESYIDRRGRLWGNGRALMDLVIGSMAPEKILEL